MGQFALVRARLLGQGLAIALACTPLPQLVMAQQGDYPARTYLAPLPGATHAVPGATHAVPQSSNRVGLSTRQRQPSELGRETARPSDFLQRPDRSSATDYHYPLGPHDVEPPVSAPTRLLAPSSPASSRPIPVAQMRPDDARYDVLPASHETPATDEPPTNASQAGEPQAASDFGEYNQPAMPQPPDFRSLILRLVCGVAVVLIACVGSLLVGKGWLQKGTLKTTNSGRLKQLDSVMLPNRSCLKLYEVDRQRVLVGLDATGLKAVLPLTTPFAEALGSVAELDDVQPLRQQPLRQQDAYAEDRAPLGQINEALAWNRRQPTQSGS
ncbi:MAG: hypothetical protein WBF93_06320 [Pirellulales bacterium]